MTREEILNLKVDDIIYLKVKDVNLDKGFYKIITHWNIHSGEKSKVVKLMSDKFFIGVATLKNEHLPQAITVTSNSYVNLIKITNTKQLRTIKTLFSNETTK